MTGLPAVGFIVDNDIDGFKGLLYSDDTLYFPKPEIFDYDKDGHAMPERYPLSSCKLVGAPFIEAIENY